jgi:hypothetical protein
LEQVESEASSGASESELQWAEHTSRQLLEPLGTRWKHTLGVVERARVVGGALEPDEAELLVAAAFVHDIGYAPGVIATGFHAVDGARFLRARGHERLACLVAYHSGAEAEAGERDLLAEQSEFADERSLVSSALTYCDLTTDSEGESVEPAERLDEIRQRYGPEAPEARALARPRSALLDDVRIVEDILSEKGVRVPAPARHKRPG